LSTNSAEFGGGISFHGSRLLQNAILALLEAAKAKFCTIGCRVVVNAQKIFNERSQTIAEQ
jgi:hypothetical protein